MVLSTVSRHPLYSAGMSQLVGVPTSFLLAASCGLALLVGACGDDFTDGDVVTTTTESSSTTASTSEDVSTTSDVGSSTVDGDSTGAPEYCADIGAIIETQAGAYHEDLGLVGLSVAVSFDACDPLRFSWGAASLESAEALTADHLMRAGSVTKIFTSVLLLKLVEERLLDLDETLDTFGLDVPLASSITIRHLLNHTSGLADYQQNDAFRQALQQDPSRVWTPQELVEYATELGSTGEPGQLHAYSNTNYVLAAMIAEHAAGESYADALRAHVLDPGGLTHTYVEAEDVWEGATAKGYVVVNGGTPQDTMGLYHASQVWASGAVVSTADDLRVFLHMLLSTDFLDPESQNALIEFVPTMLPVITQYGLGLFVLESGSVTAFGHNGAVMGFQAAALHHPGTVSTVTVMQNQLTLTASGTIAADPVELAAELIEAVDTALTMR